MEHHSSVTHVVFCTILILSGHQTSCVPVEDFFPFGLLAGDSFFPSADDEYVELSLDVDFLLFNKPYRDIYVNTNGILSFGMPPENRAYTPIQFPRNDTNVPTVAPFWADVDTRGTGTIGYRSTDDTTDIERVRSIVADAFSGLPNFVANQLIIVTWDRVGYFRRRTDKVNTFQCVVASDGSITIVIFLYADNGINWTTGDENGGIDGLGGLPAQAGFDAGDQANFKVIEGSFTDDIVNVDEKTNVQKPGLFVFQVNQVEIQAPIPKCPVIGSGTCNERLIQLACSYVSERTDLAVPTPCEDRLQRK